MSRAGSDAGEVRAVGWTDAWWARAGFGIATMALWVPLAFALGDLGRFPRLAESESQSGIPWLVVGTLGFTAFSIATVARSRSGKALVPGWSLVLPWLISLAFTFLLMALNDEGTRASVADRATEVKFFWPRLEALTPYLSFLMTLAIGILAVIDRLFPQGRLTRWLIIAIGVLPYPVLGALILPGL